MIESFTAAEFAAVRSLAEDLSGYTLLERMCAALEQYQAVVSLADQVVASESDSVEARAAMRLCLMLDARGEERSRAA